VDGGVLAGVVLAVARHQAVDPQPAGRPPHGQDNDGEQAGVAKLWGAENQFRILNEPGGYVQIQFANTNSQYNGYCIGDAGNLPGNADTGLVLCDNHSGQAGWGSVFQEKSCGFYNVHWGGYLGAASWVC
jgi:hypothetical protein